MNRTYNVFVDNGQQVLAYYLNKDRTDLTYDDIENNIDMICNKIYEFVNCEKYSNLKGMVFFNSPLSNPKCNITLNDKLKSFLEYDKGDDVCCICGQHHANILNDIGRSEIPNIVSGTFYNYSNNLKGVNICPYCLILTIYSILNIRVNGLAILYNSDNDDFLETYTYDMQDENQRDILSNAIKETKKISNLKSFTNMILDLIHNSKIFDDGYIEQYAFNNSGQSQSIEDNISIKNQELKLIKQLEDESLLNEFMNKNLMIDVLRRKIKYSYIYKLIDFDCMELKCSQELFNLLHKELNSVNKNINEIIKNVINKFVNDINKETLSKTIKELKNINSYRKFEDFIIDIIQLYKDDTNENLMTIEEYNELTNKIKFRQIKNLMIVNLVLR